MIKAPVFVIWKIAVGLPLHKCTFEKDAEIVIKPAVGVNVGSGGGVMTGSWLVSPSTRVLPPHAQQ
jgi:hypothetical protein